MQPTDLHSLADELGFVDQPLTMAIMAAPGPLIGYYRGQWSPGVNVAAADRFYAASLTKQLTGAAIAVLARDGLIDVDAPIGRCLDDLPPWRNEVTPRHLLHHTAGLPHEAALSPGPYDADAHWTQARAMHGLRSLAALPDRPGTIFRYANLGYVLLAALIERASAMSYGRFVAERIIGPLGLDSMSIWEEGSELPYPQAGRMGTSLPLTTGDGGLWTTASAFVRWLDTQNRDVLGIAGDVTQPGALLDGSPIDYGWGIGLSRFRDVPMFFHGGSWPGAVAKAVRCPALGISVAAFASDVEPDRLDKLVDCTLAAMAAEH